MIEKEIEIPKRQVGDSLIKYMDQSVRNVLHRDELPIRFVVTASDEEKFKCELGVLSNHPRFSPPTDNLFRFEKRTYENTEAFNAVLLVPTGIGAEVGGHSGDGGPLARLLAASCDTLITHPNVVNAADINELPDNSLFVEGSVISRLLMGTAGLQKVRSNRVLLVLDKHEDKFIHECAINSASAARAALGLDCPLVVMMDDKMLMHALYSTSGRAVGRIEYLERLCEVLQDHRHQYDAVALSTLIKVPETFHADYFKKEDMVNPWGGVEAMLTHAISSIFDVPSAHSPMMTSKEIMDLDVGIVDPRKSAEAVSTTYLHCILKGLHKSPRIIPNPSLQGSHGLLTATDISCLVIPDGCVGLPTLAAIEQGIPVIAVRENKNRMKNSLEDLPFAPGQLHMVENYWEASGVMNALKAGVAPASVRRPLAQTTVIDAVRIHNSLSVSQHRENKQQSENGPFSITASS
ncbi:MAG: DUF3326 domain-containing protein [Desulfobulbaceae bacterium]|nr:DUF3326 domain-containing protein [Desulfobulbaceae bacterium]